MDNSDLYKSLGEMIVNFQYLDACIERFIHGLLTLPKRHSDNILSEMAFKNKVALLSCLSKDRLIIDENNSNQINGLIKLCNQCEQERNRYVHSHYMSEISNIKGDKLRIKVTAKQSHGLKKQVEFTNLEELNILIVSTIEQMGKLMSRLEVSLNRPHLSLLSDEKQSNFDLEPLLDSIRLHYESSK